MVQTMKEYQKEYFEKEGYTIIDNMENAISAFCERYPQHTNVAEESILNDTNCDWVVLNDGSVAVLPGVLEKPVCEVSEYYGDNVFMLVSRVNKALQDERKQTCDMEPRQSNRGCILSDVRELD